MRITLASVRTVLAFSLLTSAAACGGASTPPPSNVAAPAGELRLALRTPMVGDERTYTSSVDADLIIDGKQPFSQHDEQTEHGRVLEVTAGKMSKLEIGFTGVRREQNGQVLPQPIDGNVYQVWREGGELRATHADGSEVTKDELAALTDKHLLRDSNGMGELIASHAWTIGTRYQLTDGELLKLIEANEPDEPVPTMVALTLTAFDDGTATFDLAMTLDVKNVAAQMTMTMQLTGTLRLDRASAQPLSMEMTGPVEGTVNALTIGGTSTMISHYTYKP